MPKRLISTEEIFDGALELIELRGVDALTARNLAEHLRCSHATLYHQVGNKESMTRGLVAHAFARMRLDYAPGADTAQTITNWAMTLRVALLARPAVARLMNKSDRGAMVPFALDLVAALRAHGLSRTRALSVARIVSRMTTSMTLSDLSAPTERDDLRVFETALGWLVRGIVTDLPATAGGPASRPADSGRDSSRVVG